MYVFEIFNSLFSSYDGVATHFHADSTIAHYKTSLVDFNGVPLAVGGYNANTNKAETYDISTNKWTEVANYPYHPE